MSHILENALPSICKKRIEFNRKRMQEIYKEESENKLSDKGKVEKNAVQRRLVIEYNRLGKEIQSDEETMKKLVTVPEFQKGIADVELPARFSRNPDEDPTKGIEFNFDVDGNIVNPQANSQAYQQMNEIKNRYLVGVTENSDGSIVIDDTGERAGNPLVIDDSSRKRKIDETMRRWPLQS